MSAGFHDFVRELFAGLGAVQIKRMFGGAGVYADGLMFALLADTAIYIKTDDALKAALAAQGSGPFLWTPSKGPRAGQSVEMSYWRLPDAALDDPELASTWAAKALAAARSKATAKAEQKAKA